jgi:hypothetical protein
MNTPMTDQLPIEIVSSNRLLTAAEFRRLADVPGDRVICQYA